MERALDGRCLVVTVTAAWLGFGVVLSCLQTGGEAVAPQGWWAQRGPVVPHDSFPADCGLCHTGDDWHTIRADFAFDHGRDAGHELLGAHARAECLRCHNDRGPVEVFARRGCAGCHEDEHRGTLGQECDDCHGQDDWRPRAIVARHAATRFPLIGAHAAAACWRCHEGAAVGRFTPTDAECVSCHAADLARAQSPPHVTQGWVDRCDRCHIATSWGGAGFNHPDFPLTGAHRAARCEACHAGGVWSGLPGDCFDCHSADYAAARDPDHVAFALPTDCERCHGTSSWQGARFDHRFPLRSAEHGSLSCADCHLGQSGQVFSCTHCHDHGIGPMADEHDDVPGYLWESLACYQCHPDGRE